MVVSARHYQSNYHKNNHKYALVKVCMGSLHHTTPSEHRNPSEELVRQMERANWFQRVQFQKQWQTARITELQSQVEELLAVNATQAATIEALRTRVAELEAHSGLTSH